MVMSSHRDSPEYPPLHAHKHRNLYMKQIQCINATVFYTPFLYLEQIKRCLCWLLSHNFHFYFFRIFFSSLHSIRIDKIIDGATMNYQNLLKILLEFFPYWKREKKWKKINLMENIQRRRCRRCHGKPYRHHLPHILPFSLFAWEKNISLWIGSIINHRHSPFAPRDRCDGRQRPGELRSERK